MYSSGNKILSHHIFLTFFIRDAKGKDYWYQPISVIEHLGSLSSDGYSSGHYRCDVLEKTSNQWLRTNDDCEPVQIDVQDVSRQGYAILFRRKNDK